MKPSGTFSRAEARRIALAAQGLAEPRPSGAIDRRHGRKVFDRIGVIQVDSVNVLVRSQELPLWSRLGPHRRDLLPSLVATGEVFEYWAHEAALLPVKDQPLFRFKMATAHQWTGIRFDHRPGYLDAVLAEVRDRGPLVASELSSAQGKSGPWWGWDDAKRALELLFWQGRLTARRRPQNFAREYDLTERVLPPEVLAHPTPAPDDARRELLERAARHHGIGTARDLTDYYRLQLTPSRPLLADLVESGRLQLVSVEGWKDQAYLHPEARLPRRVEAQAVLSPFDPVVWERQRAERLFDFVYRIEIYTPAPKRLYGYYVLPFLLGDELVGRVDLKADRQAGVLRVPGAFAEPGQDPGRVASALAEELRTMAAWLELDRVDVGRRGDLARPLRQSLRI